MDFFTHPDLKISNLVVQGNSLFGKMQDLLMQDFPSIKRNTIFSSSFDYVGEQYADILDIIASVLILKVLMEAFISIKNLFL